MIDVIPATVEDPMYLAAACQRFYHGTVPDDLRRREWPFCSHEASQYLASSILWSETHEPSHAWTITLRGHASEFEKLDPPQRIGLLTLNHIDLQTGVAKLGTYLSPSFRGQGLQQLAKEALFAHLAPNFTQMYCLVEQWNVASLHALTKLSYSRMIPAAEWELLPPQIRHDIWRSDDPVLIFSLDLSFWTKVRYFQ